MRYRIIIKTFLLVFLLSLLLTGCSSTQDLWVYTDGNWKMEMELEFNLEAIPGISTSLEGFGLDFDLGSITGEVYQFVLEQKVSLDRARGLDADLDVDKHGDETVYQYTLEGKNIDQLKESLMIDDALYEQFPELEDYVGEFLILQNSDGTIEIEATYPYMNLGHTFILHGKNIDDYGTATEIKGNKAYWSNPTYIHARFMPVNKIFSSNLIYLFMILGILLMGGVAFLLIQFGGISLRKQKLNYTKPNKYRNPYYKKNPYSGKNYKKRY